MADSENPPAAEETAADLFQPREGRDLIWKDLSVTLSATAAATKNKNKKSDDAAASTKDVDKKILDSVWGEVPAKQVTAIMGPSGSGASNVKSIIQPSKTKSTHCFILLLFLKY